MIWEHDAMTLLIIACSLMRLASVADSESDINYTTNVTTTTTTLVDNQYSLSALDLRKSPSERVENLSLIKWPALYNRNDDHQDDYSSTSINRKGWQFAINTERKRDNHVKVSSEEINKSGLSSREFMVDNETNSSTTKPLLTDILGDLNNGLKIAQYHDEGNVEDSRLRQQLLAVKRRRLLSSPIISAQKIIKDYSYIEVKDSPDLRITPISLLDIDYDNRDGEEFYEEMDELLKLKRMLNNEGMPKSKAQKQRGDMNPILSSPTMINNKEKIPIRGDIGTRHKRFYRDDELWGFAEDEGDVPSDEVEVNAKIPASANYSVNESLHRAHENQSIKLEIEQEKKLMDYIMRNRPIVVPYRKENGKRRNYRPVNSSGNDKSPYGVYDHGRTYGVMEQRQSPISTFNYNDLEKLSREEARINKIPVSARIIINKNPFFHSKSSSSSSTTSTTSLPSFFSRGNFDSDIVFPEISPDHLGLVAANFPAPQTESPLKMSPSACVWAIAQCCPNSADNRRLIKCFEYMDCPGVNWDPNPCRKTIIEAAREEIINYYTRAANQYE